MEGVASNNSLHDSEAEDRSPKSYHRAHDLKTLHTVFNKTAGRCGRFMRLRCVRRRQQNQPEAQHFPTELMGYHCDIRNKFPKFIQPVRVLTTIRSRNVLKHYIWQSFSPFPPFSPFSDDSRLQTLDKQISEVC